MRDVPMAGSYPMIWDPKGLREHLCVQQAMAPDLWTKAVIGTMISKLDEHRPLGPNGKHGNRHTETCGCQDK